jgi:hypothetical protein
MLDVEKKSCILCDDNCAVCSENDICDVCDENYKKDSQTRKCVEIENLFNLNKNKNNKKKEVFISPKTKKENNNLIDQSLKTFSFIKVNNCLISDASGNCLFCKLGYFHKNKKCEACSEGCIKCMNTRYCLKCNYKYSIRINENICVKKKVKEIHFLI